MSTGNYVSGPGGTANDPLVDMFAALDTLADLAKTDEGCEKFIAQYAFHGIPESALIDELSTMEDQDSIHRFGLRLWGHKWWCDKFAKVQFVRASSGIDPQQSVDDIIALHLPDTITVVVKQIRLLLDNFPSDKSPSGSNHPHQQSWAAKMQLALSTLAEVNGDDGRIRTAISKITEMEALVRDGLVVVLDKPSTRIVMGDHYPAQL